MKALALLHLPVLLVYTNLGSNLLTFASASQLQWGYEGPTDYKKSSLCGDIPADIMYRIQPEYFHIIHHVRIGKTTGRVREFAEACPTMQLIKRCDPNYQIPSEFCFTLKCSEYKFKGKDYKEWVVIPDKKPSKLCVMPESVAPAEDVGARMVTTSSASGNQQTDESNKSTSIWAYELFKEYDELNCGPVSPDLPELAGMDLENYYLEYHLRKGGKLQADIKPAADSTGCKFIIKDMTDGTTGKAYCNPKTKKWRIARTVHNLCKSETGKKKDKGKESDRDGESYDGFNMDEFMIDGEGEAFNPFAR